MEGDTPDLPAIVALKKKYGAYLWVDEAHSIGALGATGRGLCEHQRVNVLDIDVSMGTFTKAFGAVGGYIAATADMIAALRARSSAHVLSGSLAPPACAQALAAIRELQSPAGLDRVRRLQENSRMFRRRLIEAGLAVLGNEASSPVCPVRAAHSTHFCIHSITDAIHQPRPLKFQPDFARNPSKNGRVLTRMPGSKCGRRRRGLPGNSAALASGPHLHFGCAHTGRSRVRARGHFASGRPVSHALSTPHLRMNTRSSPTARYTRELETWPLYSPKNEF